MYIIFFYLERAISCNSLCSTIPTRCACTWLCSSRQHSMRLPCLPPYGQVLRKGDSGGGGGGVNQLVPSQISMPHIFYCQSEPLYSPMQLLGSSLQLLSTFTAKLQDASSSAMAVVELSSSSRHSSIFLYSSSVGLSNKKKSFIEIDLFTSGGSYLSRDLSSISSSL